MRHQKNTRKLGRTSQHRDAMLANLVASLILHKRVKTTLAKAKAARPLAEKLVTLGKTGTLHARRLAVAKIDQKDVVSLLFKDIAPGFKDRKGGYTRIVKLGAAPVRLRADRLPGMGRLCRRRRTRARRREIGEGRESQPDRNPRQAGQGPPRPKRPRKRTSRPSKTPDRCAPAVFALSSEDGRVVFGVSPQPP